MTIIIHAISSALLHFVWQGAVVASLLWITLVGSRNGSARFRYAVSCAALTIMAVLPFVTAWLVFRASVVSGMLIGNVADVPYSSGAETLAAVPSLSAWISALEIWAFPVWCAGVLILAVRLIWSSRYVAKLRREGDPAETSLADLVIRQSRRMNISRPIRVLISKLTDSPGVAGWLRPVVLLPAATVLSLSVEQLEAVLAHELAHIRRHDYLINMLQTLVETLLFYHPAVWWISSRIRTERELCCDDLAVEMCGDALNYARALTKLERLRLISPNLAMSSTAGPLMYRIQRLTGIAPEQPPSKLPAIFAVGLALICLLASLHAAYARPQTSREAEVRRDAIWLDTVKYGDLPILVRALGTLSAPSIAELKVPAPLASAVQVGQSASINLRGGGGVTMEGKVTRIESSTVNGNVAIELQTSTPKYTGRPVLGTIRIKILENVVYVGRPAVLQSGAENTLFKVEPDDSHAKRVQVRFGALSVTVVQILEGLQPGDRLILSDMTKYDGYDRISIE